MLNKVCFIILNYNNYTDTINCIHSLQSTIRRDMYDVIVVDNNSSNDSVSQLRKCLNDVEIIPNKVNRGYANGNNIGIKIAESRGYIYICILNNDTVIDIDFLTPCVDFLKNDSSIAFISPALVEYKDDDLVQSTGGDICIEKGYVNLKNNKVSRRKLPPIVESDYIGGACMLFRTEVLKKLGYIPESYFLFYEETEWCYKAKEQGFKNICLTDYYIYHKGSVSINAINGLQEYLMNRNKVVFVKRNINSKIKYIRFLMYLLFRFTYRLLLGKEKNIKIIRYYVDGIRGVIDSKYPFIVIEND